MAEKQQLKGIYGIRENQLRNYYREAYRARSATGTHLISLLERRLDNSVFRAGFALSRPAARQLVSHAFFLVNDRPTNIASYRMSPGDVVTIKTGKRRKGPFANFPKSLTNVALPNWLELNPEKYGFRVTSQPTAQEANLGVDIGAIVEFFAR